MTVVVSDGICDQLSLAGIDRAGSYERSKDFDRVVRTGRSETLLDEIEGRVVVRDHTRAECVRKDERLSLAEVILSYDAPAAKSNLGPDNLRGQFVGDDSG